MVSCIFGKVEAYVTVLEILPETSKGADGMAWCVFNGFGRLQICSVRVYLMFVRYSRRLFETTVTLLSAMASAAKMGCNCLRTVGRKSNG